MAENFPEPIRLDMSDERVQLFYPQILDMGKEYFGGRQERERHLTDHLGYMQKIFGVEVGGYLVGSALHDARHLADLPECPEPGSE